MIRRIHRKLLARFLGSFFHDFLFSVKRLNCNRNAKKKLVILAAYDSVDIRGLVKMAVLGRNYPSADKGRKVTVTQQ